MIATLEVGKTTIYDEENGEMLRYTGRGPQLYNFDVLAYSDDDQDYTIPTGEERRLIAREVKELTGTWPE